MIGEQPFHGHLVYVARFLGPFLSADAVLVENVGGFFTESPRPLSHDAREVTPKPISTSPSASSSEQPYHCF